MESWPQTALARMGYPVVRMLQARFRRDSAAAMKRGEPIQITPARFMAW